MEREIVLVFGKTGMGKTRWTRAYLRNKSRLLIIDPCLEYEGILFEDDLAQMVDHVEHYKAFRCRTPVVMDFPFMCQLAQAVGRCHLVIEEAQSVLPSTHMEISPEFADIIYRGRHTRVSLIIVAQRAATVHIAARSQFTRLIIFHQTQPADVKALQDATGLDLDIRGLGPSEYFDVTRQTVVKKVLDESRKTGRTLSTMKPGSADITEEGDDS